MMKDDFAEIWRRKSRPTAESRKEREVKEEVTKKGGGEVKTPKREVTKLMQRLMARRTT